jgi:hypothetical protein
MDLKKSRRKRDMSNEEIVIREMIKNLQVANKEYSVALSKVCDLSYEILKHFGYRGSQPDMAQAREEASKRLEMALYDLVCDEVREKP